MKQRRARYFRIFQRIKAVAQPCSYLPLWKYQFYIIIFWEGVWSLISPGIYDARIFGDAANVSQVDLTMTLVKKIFINGKFHLSINTTGFPAGNYSIDVQAQNGTVRLDEIALDGLSISN